MGREPVPLSRVSRPPEPRLTQRRPCRGRTPAPIARLVRPIKTARIAGYGATLSVPASGVLCGSQTGSAVPERAIEVGSRLQALGSRSVASDALTRRLRAPLEPRVVNVRGARSCRRRQGSLTARRPVVSVAVSRRPHEGWWTAAARSDAVADEDHLPRPVFPSAKLRRSLASSRRRKTRAVDVREKVTTRL
jgi:hypothetical protein